MAPDILFIVSHREHGLYEYLKRYSTDGPVEVVLDRRQEDRSQPAGIERRARDISRDLREQGWAIVDLRAPGSVSGRWAAAG